MIDGSGINNIFCWREAGIVGQDFEMYEEN
jgi:hypothetical protein